MAYEHFKTLVPMYRHLEFFKTLEIPQGSLCFDVGANHGEKTAALLAFAGKVIAVEPQADLAKFLLDSFQSEVRKGRLLVCPQALGSTKGISKLYPSSDPTQSMSTLSETFLEVSESFGQPWDRSQAVDVDVVTLDSLINEYGTPSYIKIDSEGSEFEILKGLTMCAPMNISFEYNTTPRLIEIALECIDYVDALCPIGYNFNIVVPSKSPDSFYLPHWVPAGVMSYILEKDVARIANFGDIYATKRHRT